MNKLAALSIGIDIGGTRTKFGLVDLGTGAILDTLVLPTEKKDAAVFQDQIGIAIDRFGALAQSKGARISGIGIGVPGFTEEDGTVRTTYGFLEFMENYPLRSIIERQFSLPCLIDNDARIVSLGEALYGKGKGFKRVLTLTLGTGVGFGFVVEGRFTELLPLAHMGGHMKISDDGAVCYCGKQGCLEELVSSTGIMRLAREYKVDFKSESVEAIFTAAATGNISSLAIIEKITAYLHIAIHNYINLFAPDIIILGGGIAKGLLPYLEKIKGTNYLSPFPEYSFQLAVSELEELAGMLGSAALLNGNIRNIEI